MSKRRRQANPCPNATKTAFPDQATADEAMRHIHSLGASQREKLPVRSYQCTCNRWHLSSQALAYSEHRGGLGASVPRHNGAR